MPLTTRIFIAVLLLIAASEIIPAEKDHHSHDEALLRDPGSHVHGEVLLNLVLEGDRLDFEMISPAMNITGFEHAPSTPQEQQLVSEAVALLGDAGNLLAVPEAARCAAGPATIETTLMQEKQHEEDAGHGHEEGHEGHAEFHVVHTLACENSGAVESVTLTLFSHFPGVERVRLQWIQGQRQGAAILEPDNAVLRFDQSP